MRDAVELELDAPPARSSPARRSTSGAVEASIGCSGRPTSSPTAAQARLALGQRDRRRRRRGRRAASAPAAPPAAGRRRHARPRRSSRRPARPGAGRRAAARARNACSGSVARAKQRGQRRAARAPASPGPAAAPIRSNAASTSATVSDGSAAGAGRSRSDAQPTPIWRWRSSPDRYATPISTSSGAIRPSAAASVAIFSSRAEVAPTAAEVSARSLRSTAPPYDTRVQSNLNFGARCGGVGAWRDRRSCSRSARCRGAAASPPRRCASTRSAG